MDVRDSPAEADYRDRFRAFIDARADELVVGIHWPENPAEVETHRRHQRVLFEGGYAGIAWPAEYGGPAGTPMQQAIVEQECAAAGFPRLINLVALGMCGPTLMEHGTDAQKQRYLPPMLPAAEIWCQLFSEPGAGSDLAAITTRATRTQRGWVVTGQKVWTSGAQYADYGLLLARTNADVPKHRGLSMFVIDMHAPNLRVRPLVQLNGDAEFNEVFLDGVELDDDALVGEVDGGWSVALTTLASERMLIGGTGTEHAGTIEELLDTAVTYLPALGPATAAAVRQDLATCWIETQANRASGYRRLTQLSRGEIPGAEASAGKLTSTRLARKVADVGVRLQGRNGVPGASPRRDWHYSSAFAVALSIAGGTDEVLKNILGERVLGLPSEPRVTPRATTSG